MYVPSLNRDLNNFTFQLKLEESTIHIDHGEVNMNSRIDKTKMNSSDILSTRTKVYNHIIIIPDFF